MKNGRRTRPPVDLFEASLATGIGQALAGWAAEYTHRLLEDNPDLRKRLQENWLLMFELIARRMGPTKKRHRRMVRRARAR